MKPYYADDLVTLYHGDCREILPMVSADVLVTDPPYGVAERTDRASKGRSNATHSIDFAPVHGDDIPFEPSHLLRFGRAVIFGANYFCARLPHSPSWIVWDKRDGTTSDDNADCEMAWTNLGGPARVIRHLWRGMIKASERDQCRVHPTQKPVAVMAQIIERASTIGETIVDPYFGSGSTLIAAADLNRKAIGIEIEEKYCEIAARRLASRTPSLFGGAT